MVKNVSLNENTKNAQIMKMHKTQNGEKWEMRKS